MDFYVSESTAAASSNYKIASGVQQPLYTTAGTIYNPNAAQRLQPPTRRGRLTNWPPGGGPHFFGSEPSYLPRSFIVNASQMRGAMPSPPVNFAYQPLQQNHDRALTPPVIRDRGRQQPVVMQSYMRSGNLPVIKSPSDSLDDRMGAGPVEDLVTPGDQTLDDDSSMKSLDHLPVKALFNLMSYPNPSQEQARKRWDDARQSGAATTAPPSATSSRPNCSTSSFPSKSGGLCAALNLSDEQMPQSLVVLHQRLHPENDTKGSTGPAARSSTPSPDATYIHQPTPVRAGTSQAHISGLLSAAAPSGSGALRPLTAGPPGQRQYRPSTFESTLKALRGTATSQSSHKDGLADCNDGPSTFEISKSTLQLTSIAEPSNGHSRPLSVATNMTNSRMAPGMLFQKPTLPTWDAKPEPHLGVNVTGSSEHSLLGEPCGSLSTVEVYGCDWRSSRMSLEEQEHRNYAINQYWYAGLELMNQNTDGPTASDWTKPFNDDQSVEESERQNSLRKMTVEEAIQMPTSEHTRPLLNMAMMSIERYLSAGGLDVINSGPPLFEGAER